MVTGLAASFLNPGVATAYAHRPPYPPALLEHLLSLMPAGPRHVLDLGAGDGALARPLAAMVDRVDAVDVSAAMVEAGRSRPGGDRPNLNWIVGAAETAAWEGPYALCTTGASLHWMDVRAVLSRLAGMLVAIVDQSYHDLPWRRELVEVIVRHSRSPGYDPAASRPGPLADSLAGRGLFTVAGSHRTEPVPFHQPVTEYVEQFHSTSSLARELMRRGEAAAFGQAVHGIVAPYADRNGSLTLYTTASVVWGLPLFHDDAETA